MTNEDKRNLKNILNYNGVKTWMIASMLLWGPFVFEIFLRTEIFADRNSFAFPSVSTIIIAETVTLIMLGLRLLRGLIVKSFLLPKKDLSRSEYELCLTKIGNLKRQSDAPRMQKDKYKDRTDKFKRSIAYFERKIKDEIN